jgi:hypothetical protein
MRRASTNEKQLSKNFLVQRRESELKVTTPALCPLLLALESNTAV